MKRHHIYLKNSAALLVAAAMILLCAACSSSDDDASTHPSTADGKGTVTLLLPVEGLGDNGYYDDIVSGVSDFAEASGARLQLLFPDSLDDARAKYAAWLSANANQANALLVLTAQSYAGLVRQQPPSLSGQGAGVIVVDPDSAALPVAAVTTVGIDRYQACYLAGAMCSELSVVSLLAGTSLQAVSESAQGFSDGHAAYAADTLSRTVAILAADERGFDQPDSAYRFTAERSYEFGLIIFPMVGGSATGVYRALEGDLYSTTMAVGMEGDKSSSCSRVPFSVVYRVGSALQTMLQTWSTTGQLPAPASLTLDNGGAAIVFNDDFLYRHTYPSSTIWDRYWYAADGYFQNLYQKYRHSVPQSPYTNH